jgi:hypothetical protein
MPVGILRRYMRMFIHTGCKSGHVQSASTSLRLNICVSTKLFLDFVPINNCNIRVFVLFCFCCIYRYHQLVRKLLFGCWARVICLQLRSLSELEFVKEKKMYLDHQRPLHLREKHKGAKSAAVCTSRAAAASLHCFFLSWAKILRSRIRSKAEIWQR